MTFRGMTPGFVKLCYDFSDRHKKMDDLDMALMLLSLFLSLIAGCLLWVILGERFPWNDDIKLPPLNNIVIYTLLAIVPVYLTLFFLYYSAS